MEPDFIKVAEPSVGEEEARVVREVLLSGNYASGSKVEEFEFRFAKYIGVDYAVAVNSGTSALHIALEALGVKKGDEVIVPPLTFFATVSAVIYLNAIPVFADIDLDDLCLSPESVEHSISSKTKAIIPVHLFGAAAKLDKLITISRKYNVSVLEDCAQAHGSEFKGKRVGGFGEAGAFSFFATKHMTTGEGGMITTNNPKVAEVAKVVRNHGMSGRDIHERLGFNNRMTEIEAALGLVQLKKLDHLNELRIANSEYLIQNVKSISWAEVPMPNAPIKHTYFWCPLMVKASSDKKIQDLKEHLMINKIGFRQRYQEPLYKQPALVQAGINCSDIYLPNVEKIAGKVIGLPNHSRLTKNNLDRILEVLNSF